MPAVSLDLDDFPSALVTEAQEGGIAPASDTAGSPPPPAVIVAEKQNEKLRVVEDEIFSESMTVMRDAMYFREIDPGIEEPPEEWVRELGQEAAENRLRMARAAWMNQKEAPVGLSLAKSIMTAVTKARSGEKTHQQLAIAIHVAMPQPAYPERVLENK